MSIIVMQRRTNDPAAKVPRNFVELPIMTVLAATACSLVTVSVLPAIW
jgi:hypothetical protein